MLCSHQSNDVRVAVRVAVWLKCWNESVFLVLWITNSILHFAMNWCKFADFLTYTLLLPRRGAATSAIQLVEIDMSGLCGWRYVHIKRTIRGI